MKVKILLNLAVSLLMYFQDTLSFTARSTRKNCSVTSLARTDTGCLDSRILIHLPSLAISLRHRLRYVDHFSKSVCGTLSKPLKGTSEFQIHCIFFHDVTLYTL